MMRTVILAAAGLAAGLLPSVARAAEPVELFNGKDFSGWTYCLRDPDVKMADVWTVKDGVIHCAGKPVGYLRTEKKYTSYVLTLEWRWPEDSKPGNSGVLVRIIGPDKVWPKCVEAQLANRRAGDIFTIDSFPLKGNPERTKGRYTAMARETNEKPQGEWNTYEITLKGPELTLKVNGEVQNEATGVEVVPGYIGLQSEGAPVEFRNIRLQPLE
jgi:hypothetical protein